jgi:hypothetical protein
VLKDALTISLKKKSNFFIKELEEVRTTLGKLAGCHFRHIVYLCLSKTSG